MKRSEPPGSPNQTAACVAWLVERRRPIQSDVNVSVWDAGQLPEGLSKQDPSHTTRGCKKETLNGLVNWPLCKNRLGVSGHPTDDANGIAGDGRLMCVEPTQVEDVQGWVAA